MVDFYDCDHECQCERNGQLRAAQQYSSLLSKMQTRCSDCVCVTKEEKESWNKKANQDIVDLIKMMVEKHDEKLEELDENLDKKVQDIINKLGLSDDILSKYATIEYVNQLVAGLTPDVDLSEYLKKVDFQTAKEEIYNKINEIAGDVANANTNVTNLTTKVNNLNTKVDNISSTTGPDYSIESFTYDTSNGKLTLKQKNNGTYSVTIVASGSGSDIPSDVVTQSELQEAIAEFVKRSELRSITLNGETISLIGSGSIKINTNSGGSTTGGKDGGRYKNYFAINTSSTVWPALPINGSAPDSSSAWKESCGNRTSGEFIWLTQVFIDGDGNYGDYMTPICITGDKGDPGSSSTGADSTDVEFIYKRYLKDQSIISPTVSENTDGYVPDGWTDNPQGVDETYVNECICVRFKRNGTWGSWSTAVIWSHYGETGTDGDGVEYIFTVSDRDPSSDPFDWYTNEESKADTAKEGYNADEYIEPGSGWVDDPGDLEQEQGTKIWVSIRKKRNDSDSESSETTDAYWHQYSHPKIWAYYAKDGVATAIVLDAVGETQNVYIDADTKLNSQYQSSIEINMYNTGDTIGKTLEVESFKKSDGTSCNTSYFETTSDYVTVNIPAGELTFDSGVYYVLRVKGTPTNTNISSQVRRVEIKFYGIQAEGRVVDGENAIRLDLDNENQSIACDANGKPLASIQDVYVHLYDGNTEKTSEAEYSISSSTGLSSSASPSIGSDHKLTGIELDGSLNVKQATVTVKAEYKGTNYFATCSITKAFPGENGEPATTYWLVPSTNVIKVDANGNYSPSFITCKTYKKTGENEEEEDKNCVVAWSSDDGDTYNVLNSTITSGIIKLDDIKDKKSIMLIMTKGSDTSGNAIVLDKETIPIVYDGAPGDPGKKGDDGADSISYKLNLGCAAITIQDGAYYPSLITPTVLATTNNTSTPYYATSTGDNIFKFSYLKDSEYTYTDITTTSISTEGSTQMKFRAQRDAYTDSDGVFHSAIILYETVPIVKSGENGISAVSYNLTTGVSDLNYVWNKTNSNYDLSCTIQPQLYKTEGTTSSTVLTKDYNLSVTVNDTTIDTTGFTDLGYYRRGDISTTTTKSSCTILLKATTTTGAHMASFIIPVSAAGKDGKDSESGSTGQTLAGSPLRIRGEFDKTKDYYDGKRATDAGDGVMYQDVVMYNNSYWVCVNYDTWHSEKNSDKTPATSTAFNEMSISEDTFVNMLVANKANIRELSSEEVVIFEKNSDGSDGDIVAGMTSSKAVDDKSYLYGKVDENGKNDVRIWAGKMTSAGDLSSTPFHVTEEGAVIATKGKIGSFEIYNFAGDHYGLKANYSGSNISTSRVDVTPLYLGVGIGKYPTIGLNTYDDPHAYVAIGNTEAPLGDSDLSFDGGLVDVYANTTTNTATAEYTDIGARITVLSSAKYAYGIKVGVSGASEENHAIYIGGGDVAGYRPYCCTISGNDSFGLSTVYPSGSYIFCANSGEITLSLATSGTLGSSKVPVGTNFRFIKTGGTITFSGNLYIHKATVGAATSWSSTIAGEWVDVIFDGTYWHILCSGD